MKTTVGVITKREYLPPNMASNIRSGIYYIKVDTVAAEGFIEWHGDFPPEEGEFALVYLPEESEFFAVEANKGDTKRYKPPPMPMTVYKIKESSALNGTIFVRIVYYHGEAGHNWLLWVGDEAPTLGARVELHLGDGRIAFVTKKED